MYLNQVISLTFLELYPEVNVTHLVGGHFIGNASLARLAQINFGQSFSLFVRKIKAFCAKFKIGLKVIPVKIFGSHTVALTYCKQSGHV